MITLHPSTSAVGSHLDEETSKLAQRSGQKPEMDYLQAEREMRVHTEYRSESDPTEMDRLTEEAMHLDR